MTREHRPIWYKREGLLDALGARLSEHGFIRRSRDYHFYKRTNFGWVSVGLNFAMYPEEFLAAIDIAVRFAEVEELVNVCREDLSDAEKKKLQTATLGCELGNLKGIHRREWRVDLATDVAQVAAEMTDCFVEVGLPYFKRFSTKEAVYAALGKEDETSWLYAPGPLVRAESAIALALLIGGSEEAEKMIEAKRRYIESIDVPQDLTDLSEECVVVASPSPGAMLRRFDEFVAQFKRHVSME